MGISEAAVRNLIDKLQYFDYDKVLNDIRKTVKKPGVLVTGATGTGKSSLINHLFGEDAAPAGSGRPLTDRIACYEPEDYEVVLYDTLGYEIGEEKQQKFYQEVVGFVKEANEKKEAARQVHLTWYCISAANKRVTPADLEAVAALTVLTQVCVVLTQIDGATREELQALRETLKETLPGTDVFSVSLDPRLQEDPSVQWDELLCWSMEHLDSGLRLAFAQALGKELEIKRLESDRLIRRYVVAAAGAVAAPLPMTDSAALIAIQTAMATHLFNYWGIDRGTDKIRDVFVNVVVANTGRIFSRSLLKLIPGAGSIAAVMVNGGVATSFTYAFGRAINEICYKAAVHLARGEKVDISSAFAMDVVMALVRKYYHNKEK